MELDRVIGPYSKSSLKNGYVNGKHDKGENDNNPFIDDSNPFEDG